MANKYYIGVLYDKVTSAIGNRIMQDLIAVDSVLNIRRKNLVICTPDPELVQKALSGFDFQYSNDLSKPRIFLNYKCGDVFEVCPDNTQTEIQRDLQVRVKPNNLLLDHDTMGHALKEDNRMSYTTMNKMYNHPNGYAPPDAALVMMWGPVKC